MGCFNILSSISRLPILENDEVYCMVGLKTNSCDSDYWSATDNFLPITFPFIGYYNDYGSISDIEETDYTNILCDYFGYNDIQELVLNIEEDVNRNGKELVFEDNNLYKTNNEKFEIGIFYEHTWWVDMMTSFKPSDENNPNYLNLDDWTLTKYLPFKKVEETEENIIYQYKDVRILREKVKDSIWESSLSNVLWEGKPIKESWRLCVSSVDSLIKIVKELYGFDIKPLPGKEDWTTIRCRYEKLLSLIEEATQVIGSTDIITNMILMDNFFITSEQKHSGRDIKVDLEWFNRLRNNGRFSLLRMIDKDSPIMTILGGKEKYYENFLESDLKEGKYPKYFLQAMKLIELEAILSRLTWKFNVYQVSTQEPLSKTIFYIKEREVEFLKQRKY